MHSENNIYLVHDILCAGIFIHFIYSLKNLCTLYNPRRFKGVLRYHVAQRRFIIIPSRSFSAFFFVIYFWDRNSASWSEPFTAQLSAHTISLSLSLDHTLNSLSLDLPIFILLLLSKFQSEMSGHVGKTQLGHRLRDSCFLQREIERSHIAE